MSETIPGNLGKMTLLCESVTPARTAAVRASRIPGKMTAWVPASLPVDGSGQCPGCSLTMQASGMVDANTGWSRDTGMAGAVGMPALDAGASTGAASSSRST